MALMLLWEADHDCTYPTEAVEFVGRLTTFSKRLMEAVMADVELSAWLHHRQCHWALAPGTPSDKRIRWSVRIRASVGEPFLKAWTQYLADVVSCQAAVEQVESDDGPARKRLRPEVKQRQKRPRQVEENYLPLHTKQARVERLRAEHAAGRGQVAGRDTEASARAVGGAPGPQAVGSRVGRATQGPPT